MRTPDRLAGGPDECIRRGERTIQPTHAVSVTARPFACRMASTSFHWPLRTTRLPPTVAAAAYSTAVSIRRRSSSSMYGEDRLAEFSLAYSLIAAWAFDAHGPANEVSYRALKATRCSSIGSSFGTSPFLGAYCGEPGSSSWKPLPGRFRSSFAAARTASRFVASSDIGQTPERIGELRNEKVFVGSRYIRSAFTPCSNTRHTGIGCSPEPSQFWHFEPIGFVTGSIPRTFSPRQSVQIIVWT